MAGQKYVYESHNCKKKGKRLRLLCQCCSYSVLILNISREKSSIVASQRRMERKLKEVNATLDQERTQHVEQRDQVRTPIFC